MTLTTVLRPWRILLAATALALVTPSISSAALTISCGDGFVDETEQCDDGNTVGGDCCDAACRFEQPGSSCSDDGNQCTIDTCDGLGTCDHAIRQGPCDDGNSCTSGDTCNSDGFCMPETTAQDGSGCADPGLCGGAGTCFFGYCAGPPADCAGYGDACNPATCDAQTGQCNTSLLPDGTPCDNGNFCLDPGTCSDGSCDQPLKDCSAFSDPCHVGFCDVELRRCTSTQKEDGSICDDGNGCTVGDFCTAGLCDGEPRDCSQLTDACNVGICNGDLGDCQADPRNEGETCDDANTCTTGDKCGSGSCEGVAVDCSGLDDSCHTGSCNAQTGACQADPKPNGETCSDGNTCTTGDQCNNGSCSGTTVNCSGLDDSCHSGSCNAQTGACQADPKPNGETCSDGNTCTTGDQCNNGSCSGTTVNCSGLDGECTTGACDPNSGGCNAHPKANGTACDDGAFCTKTDTCTRGVCSGTGDPCAGAPACANACDEAANSCNAPQGTACPSDGNPCTDDVCDGAGHCSGVANNASCDDGLFCTSHDHCVEGLCTGGETCPSDQTCGDTCNEKEDACRTCGHPFSNSHCLVNAVFVLQGAIHLRACEICTCDVDSDGSVTVTDALSILRSCAKLPSNLRCPSPTSTTSTSTSTTLTPTTTLGGP